jgi:hypothetical protein
MIPLLLAGLLAAAPADELVRGPHLPSPAALKAARAPDVQDDLARLAFDRRAPLSTRTRAIHLLGLGPTPRAEQLWRSLAAGARDPRVRAEAAWALGLSRRFADPTLLEDKAPEVRAIYGRLVKQLSEQLAKGR